MVVAMAEFDRYRGPNVAVDVAVFTLTDDGLAVLIQHRDESPRGDVVPGRFLREGETVNDCLRATLEEKVGTDVEPTAATLDDVGVQSDSANTAVAHWVGAFDRQGRDERSSWSLSLAYYIVVAADRLGSVSGRFVPVALGGGIEPRLLFDHDDIVRRAAADVRQRYEITPDPDNLCGAEEVTLPDLQRVHEAVLGAPLRVDTFRRRMAEMLTEVVDPDDPRGARKTTRPRGSRGGPPTGVWARNLPRDGAFRLPNGLHELPRKDSPA